MSEAIPPTVEEIAFALFDAMWGHPGYYALSDRAFRTPYDRAADLVLVWLAATRRARPAKRAKKPDGPAGRTRTIHPTAKHGQKPPPARAPAASGRKSGRGVAGTRLKPSSAGGKR